MKIKHCLYIIPVLLCGCMPAVDTDPMDRTRWTDKNGSTILIFHDGKMYLQEFHDAPNPYGLKYSCCEKDGQFSYVADGDMNPIIKKGKISEDGKKMYIDLWSGKNLKRMPPCPLCDPEMR